MPYIDPYQPKTTTISQPTTQVQTTTSATTTSSPRNHVVHIPTQTPKKNKVFISLFVFVSFVYICVKFKVFSI